MSEPSRTFLVMPALDEEEALPLVLADLPAGAIDVIVVCDNGSRDRTGEVARAAGAHVVREARRGYGSACLAALDAIFARGSVEPAPGAPARDQDAVVFLDADRSDHAEDVTRVLAPVQAGDLDLCIGSRLLGGASMRALLPQAWFGNRLACFLMRVLFGLRATDLGPLRAIRVDALQSLGMADRGFGWTIEMQLRAHSAGLRVGEVSVRYRPRVGRSKITGTWSGTLRAGWAILGWIVRWRLSSLRRSPRSR